MRSSEEMAMVLYRTWARHNRHSDTVLVTWDDIGEYAQELYLAQVNAFMEYLFEHGRISQYLNVERLGKFREEYSTYLEQKTENRHYKAIEGDAVEHYIKKWEGVTLNDLEALRERARKMLEVKENETS